MLWPNIEETIPQRSADNYLVKAKKTEYGT